MKSITCIQSKTNLDSSCCFYLQENSETSTGDDERSGMNNIHLTVCLSSEKGLSTTTGPHSNQQTHTHTDKASDQYWHQYQHNWKALLAKQSLPLLFLTFVQIRWRTAWVLTRKFVAKGAKEEGRLRLRMRVNGCDHRQKEVQSDHRSTHTRRTRSQWRVWRW